MKNTTKKHEFDVDKEAVKILRVAAFCFSIVSWLATAEGLANYVFDNDWRVYVISFAIQSILFIFNLQLPVYWEKLQLKRLKALFIILYTAFLFSSSVFSFVYICTNAVYLHRVGYTDASIILNSEYKDIWNQTEKYIDEYKKYSLLQASRQLESFTGNNVDNGESSEYSLTELQALERKAEKEYNEALGNYNIEYANLKNVGKKRDDLFDVRFVRKNEYQKAEEDYNNQLDITNKAERLKNSLKEKYEDARIAVENYKPSGDVITQALLVELLSSEPDKDNITQKMDALNKAVLELGGSDNSISTFNKMVEQTKALDMTISQYVALVEADEIGHESLDLQAQIPDPKSETFETDYTLWTEEWMKYFDTLEKTINSLPTFELATENDTINGAVNTSLLKEYDSKALTARIDTATRTYLSDMNDIEKSVNLLGTKYNFTAIFSCILALFFDLASLAVGLFVHQITKDNS